MTNSKATTFPVRSMRLAGHLMTLGFILIDIDKADKAVRKNVFFFKDTPQIQKAIQDYLNSRDRK